MNVNNKDLYQILKVDKNASQQQIIKVSQDLVKKDSPDEVGIARLVLSDPQKRAEYDRVGWKEEWGDEWRNRKDLCNSVFEAIHEEFKKTYRREEPEAWIYHVLASDLDSSLWAPMNDGRFHGSDAAWVEKIHSIVGPNWRQNLEDFRDKMITAIRKKYQENKQNNPSNSEPKHKYEYKEKFNCGKCGKHVEMFPYCGGDGKRYCSFECLDEAVFKLLAPKEYKKADYICARCHKEDKDVYKMENGRYYHKSCFDKELERKQNPDKYDDNPVPNPDDNKNNKTPEEPESDPIKRLGKDIESYKSKKKNLPEKDKQGVQDLIDKLERELKAKKLEKFLADKKGETRSSKVVEYNRFTGKTTKKEVKWNPLLELLNWMKKEGIVNISLNSKGNLVVEYGNLTETVEDNKLSKEQKEIKEFFQQNPDIKQSLNQNELEKEVAAMERTNNKDNKGGNGWVVPVVIGMGAVILILIGVIIYKSKKKGY